jgi:nitrous oxidase accessory protein NosD
VNEIVSASGIVDANCGSGLGTQPVFTTVQSAVDTATPGDTIYVCAGTYTENLTISKPLTILGAEHDVTVGAGDTSTRTDATDESILKGDVSYRTGATTGTLSGFTLIGTATDVPVVQAKQVGSGWRFTDDIVDVSNGGFQFDTDNQEAPPYSAVADDRFVQATPSSATSGWAGQAVTFSSVAHNVYISANAFDYLTGPGAAINTTPFGATTACASISSPPTATQLPDLNTDLYVTGNTMVQDDSPTHVGSPGHGNEDNFIALFCVYNAEIRSNTITTTSPGDGDANSGIYLGGSDWTATISSNTLVGDGAPNASGITDSTDFYPASEGIYITSNTVSGYLYGIHLRGAQTGFWITNNTVTGSLSGGISITGSTATGGNVVDNKISGTTPGAGHYDCADHTTGGGTAGTANSWHDNVASTGSPRGLCSNVSVPRAPTGVSAIVAEPGIYNSCGAGLTRYLPVYSTLQLAMNAVNPGRTIYVCAGTYTGNVTINKHLTILGAQWSVPAGAGHTSARTNPTNESILKGDITYAPSGGFTPSTGILAGFTLEGTAADVPVVKAKQVGSNWGFTNDIVDVSNGGLQFDTDNQSTPPTSRVIGDRFVQATPSSAGTGWEGQAVTFSSVANNVTISNNAFDYLTGPGAAINTTPFSVSTGCSSISSPPTATQEGDFNKNLTVTGNTLVQDDSPTHVGTPGSGNEDNFIALFCTTGATISNNTITTTSAHDADANSGIYLGGGDWTTTILGNTIVGDGATNASGITDSTDFYPASSNVSINSNTISGYLYGIHVRGTQSLFNVSLNNVTGSLTDGISITGSTATGGTLTSNVVGTASSLACADHTTGSGTAGTGNTWTHNVGANSSPSGLCAPSSLTSITPSAGKPAGGTTVTISGVNVNAATAVKFGSTTAASFTVTAATTTITAVTRAHAAATVTVTVTTPTGTQNGLQYTFDPVPTVSSITPTAGYVGGGNTVTIIGTGFVSGSVVNFGDATPVVTVTSSTKLTVPAPPGHAAGPVTVSVSTPGGTSNAKTYTYDYTPAISGITPVAGPTGGGTTVTISGSNFVSGATVDFGAGHPAATVHVLSTSTITAKAPAHAAGTVTVTVTTPGGTSGPKPYTYESGPTISSVTPAAGKLAGGTTVTLSGGNYVSGATVSFGGNAGTTVHVVSTSTITVKAPAHATGSVTVTVSTPGGTSNAKPYTYDVVPTITSLSRTSGPVAGGTSVTVNGTGLTGVQHVKFGTTTARAYTVVSTSQITATSPAHAAVGVTVSVTTPGGTTAPSAADAYTYTYSTPSVSSISPNLGLATGGTTVTVNGSGLNGATQVLFGSATGTSITVNAAGTQLTVTSPAGTFGTVVDVRVFTPVGESAVVAADKFTYGSGAAITAMSRTNGPVAGGSSVTITGHGFSGVTHVKFGTTTAKSYSVKSSGQIVAVSPAHGASQVRVSVTTSNGTTPAAAADLFTFH